MTTAKDSVPQDALSAIEPTPDAAEELEVVAYLVDFPVQPVLEFADVHVPDAAEPLVRQSDALAIIEKLRAENDEWSRRYGYLYEGENKRAEAAEARLAEAVEVLRRIASMSGTAGSEDGGEGTRTVNGESEPTRILRGASANEIARTFLQSLGKEG